MQRAHQPIRMADAYEELCGLVPAPLAARYWHSMRGDAFATERQRACLAVSAEIRRYNPVVLSGKNGRGWTHEVVFQVEPRACPVCSVEFLAEGRQPTCSPSCGGRYRWLQKRDAGHVDHVQHVVGVVPLPEEPSAFAMEVSIARAIVEALRGIEDPAARDRVMAYVRALA